MDGVICVGADVAADVVPLCLGSLVTSSVGAIHLIPSINNLFPRVANDAQADSFVFR